MGGRRTCAGVKHGSTGAVVNAIRAWAQPFLPPPPYEHGLQNNVITCLTKLSYFSVHISKLSLKPPADVHYKLADVVVIVERRHE